MTVATLESAAPTLAAYLRHLDDTRRLQSPVAVDVLLREVESGGPRFQAAMNDPSRWRVQSPHTETALEAIAAGSADKVVAKAARKALFSLRSRPRVEAAR